MGILHKGLIAAVQEGWRQTNWRQGGPVRGTVGSPRGPVLEAGLRDDLAPAAALPRASV